LDGDWCIRKTDGENFERVSGAWVDQGFTNRSTANVTAARAYRAAAFTPAANTWTKVPLDTANYDVQGNLLNLVNGRVVCPVAGVYAVSGAVLTNGLSATGTYTGTAAGIYKNGTMVTEWDATPAVQSVITATTVDTIQCAAGDYLELWTYCSQGASIFANPVGTYLAVALVTAGAGPQGPQGPPGSLGVQPAMKLTLSTSPAVPLTTPMLIPFDTVGWSQGSMTRSPNGGFTVPSAGLYQIVCNMLWNTAMNGRVDYMVVNYTQQGLANGDVSTAIGGGGAIWLVGQYQSSSFTAIVQANANDVLGIVLMNRSSAAGAVYGLNNWTSAQCIRVSS
jgi:hypothetical protein